LRRERSGPIERARHAAAAAVQYVGVDHRRPLVVARKRWTD